MQKPVFSRCRLNSRCATLASLLAAVLASACGGGGGGDTGTTTPPTTLSAAALQGRWVTASGISPARTGVVVPGAAGATELWLLSADLLSLARLQITTSGSDAVSASGKSYTLPSTSTNVGQAANYSGSASLANNTLSLNAGTLQLIRSDALTAASSQAAIAGNWNASVGNQTVTLNWAIAADGKLSGPSSTGCSYSGTLAARSDASVYNASLTENCSSGSVSFAGIATYRAAQGNLPAALTLATTSTDGNQTQALVVSLAKP